MCLITALFAGPVVTLCRVVVDDDVGCPMQGFAAPMAPHGAREGLGGEFVNAGEKVHRRAGVVTTLTSADNRPVNVTAARAAAARSLPPRIRAEPISGPRQES